MEQYLSNTWHWWLASSCQSKKVSSTNHQGDSLWSLYEEQANWMTEFSLGASLHDDDDDYNFIFKQKK